MIAPVGLVGLGLLGRGIATCLLERGFTIIAMTPSSAEHDSAIPIINTMIGELVDRGLSAPTLRNDWRQRFQPTTEWKPFGDCDFVIESVTEDLAIKRSVFDAVENVVTPETIISSNTSAIPISVLQQSRRHPERFVGMHWAEPAHATRFLELIRGESTSDATLERTEAFARQLGKDPTICRKDVPGFIVNRIAYAMYREALFLVEQGIADVESIDRSLRNTLGLWAASCGPFRWIDLTGGPALYGRAMERVLPTLCNDATLPEPLAKLMAADARGIVNGHGFYEYSPADAQTWEELQRRHAWQVKAWLDAEFPLTTAPANE